MAKSWTIVLCSPANRKDVIEAMRVCLPENNRAVSRARQHAAERLLVDASSGRIYLLYVRGSIAGLAIVCFQNSVLEGGRLAVLEKICLLEKFKGQGLAQKFLRGLVGDLEAFGEFVVTAYLPEQDPLATVFELEGYECNRVFRFSDPTTKDDEID